VPRAIVAVCQAGSLKVLPYGLLANVIFGYFPRTGAKNLIGGTRQRKNSSALVCAIGEVAPRDFAARWQSALYSLGVSYCCCVVPFPLGELVWTSGETVLGWRINTVRCYCRTGLDAMLTSFSISVDHFPWDVPRHRSRLLPVHPRGSLSKSD